MLTSSVELPTKSETSLSPVEYGSIGAGVHFDSPVSTEKKIAVKGEKQPSSSPLSEEGKLKLIEKLKEVAVDDTRLRKALIETALNNIKFPIPLNEKLDTLQSALTQNAGNRFVLPHLEEAIRALVETEIIIQFKDLLNKPIQRIESWSGRFLYFLAEHLNINIEKNPIVEATIKDGKIYWRILKDEKEIYDRQKAKKLEPGVFTEETSWRMDWKLFRIFKDSGKRSSSVAITEALFTKKFGDEEQVIAASIWKELKEAGILNSRFRLSHSWRVLSNTCMKLKTIEDLKCSTVKLTKENKIKWYNYVILALNSIVNDPGNAEVLEAMPDARIYRPELSLKTWASTGLIRHSSPKTEHSSCTRLWEVGTYDELDKHRLSDEEKKKYDGDILNYDHIPSTSALKNSSSSIAKKYNTEIEQHRSVLKSINSEIKSLEGSPKGLKTRQQEQVPIDPKIKELQDRAANKSNEIQALENDFDMETRSLAFAVAIPKKLHRQGDTFLESAQSQSSSTEHPFLRDVTTYLDKLESQPKDFKLESPDDYIKALGAFRYMYRTQCKQPVPLVGGRYSIGSISHSFFQDQTVRKKIDSLFQERIKRFIEKREGQIDVDSRGEVVKRALFT